MKFCKLIILTENLTIMENVINLRFFFQVIAACSTTLFANLCYALVSSEDLNGTFTNYVTQLGEGFITFYTTAVHGSTVINKFCLWFYSLLLFFCLLGYYWHLLLSWLMCHWFDLAFKWRRHIDSSNVFIQQKLITPN